MSEPLVQVTNLTYSFGIIPSLRNISAEIQPGIITGLVGPDGSGKTTFLRVLAGLLKPRAGRVLVLGRDIAQDPAAAHPDIGYMPQGFGLYEDLTVAENLSLFADLHELSANVRDERVTRLLTFTGLKPFTGRLAGQLSGGMKQKLGLACALLARPRLLLLDEPSVGVDPLSRRQLWAIVAAMLAESPKPGMGIIWATAYLDEAERCGRVLLLHEGHLIVDAQPAEFLAPLKGRVFRLTGFGARRRQAARRASANPAVLDALVEGDTVRVVLCPGVSLPPLDVFGATAAAPAAPRFEDGFVAVLGGASHRAVAAPWALPSRTDAIAIEVRNLLRRFGSFVAVDRLSFEVQRGEIFGLLGPNGAGKSTTFRMLCGLLQPSEGSARVAGQDLLHAAAAARARIGYMAQRFSLYAELSVVANLRFFGRVYGLRGSACLKAVRDALERFDLSNVAQTVAGELPLGIKQRLALAAALLHRPEILFLDEPTSGVDPLTRREFWDRIGTLSDSGVAVLVSSHFMDEAEYCDRLGIINRGRLIAIGTPAELRARARTEALPDPTLEDAFIALMLAAEPEERAA